VSYQINYVLTFRYQHTEYLGSKSARLDIELLAFLKFMMLRL